MKKYFHLPANKKYPTWIAVAHIQADIQKHMYTNYGIVRNTTSLEQNKKKSSLIVKLCGICSFHVNSWFTS